MKEGSGANAFAGLESLSRVSHNLNVRLHWQDTGMLSALGVVETMSWCLQLTYILCATFANLHHCQHAS